MGSGERPRHPRRSRCMSAFPSHPLPSTSSCAIRMCLSCAPTNRKKRGGETNTRQKSMTSCHPDTISQYGPRCNPGFSLSSVPTNTRGRGENIKHRLRRVESRKSLEGTRKGLSSHGEATTTPGGGRGSESPSLGRYQGDVDPLPSSPVASIVGEEGPEWNIRQIETGERTDKMDRNIR